MTQRHWIQSYGEIPADINPDAFPSVVAMLDKAIAQFPEHVAFRCAGQSITYAEVDRQSRNFAAYLQQTHAIKKGDRIAVMLPNIIEFPVACLGIARAGACQVNVNPMYTPRELEHQLNDAGVSLIVVFEQVAATVAQVMAQTPLKTVISVNMGDAIATAQAVSAASPQIAGSLRFADVLKAGAGQNFQPVDIAGSDLLFLQYTGGTTGLSKGASLSHRNLVANVEQFRAFMHRHMRPGEEVVVTAIPLYHIFALMVNFITYFSVGAENWLVPNARDMDSLIDTMKAARPTVFTGVNTLFNGIVAHPRAKEIDFSRLGMAAGGGAAVVAATSDKWKALTGDFIREGYGLSETSPVLSFNPCNVTQFSGTTGLPIPSTDVKLLKDDDTEAALGESGEICVKGPQVMSGYWQKPEANATAFTHDGYFRTGDIGVFDAAGNLKIVDRKKDMIIVSGFNVFPNEVEAIVTACPGVLECACIGVPDTKTGEAVKVVVVPAPGATLTAEEITDFCRKEMTSYKVPKLIEIVSALPKSTVGKILRRELRSTT